MPHILIEILIAVACFGAVAFLISKAPAQYEDIKQLGVWLVLVAFVIYVLVHLLPLLLH